MMSVALTARAISDGWTMILYGAGFLRVYAPLVLVGAMFNPAITLGVLWSIPQEQIGQNVGLLYQSRSCSARCTRRFTS
ncbi:MAG: hypothetical protein V9F04_01150 [Dermatophilaceae bacterium]